jgi:hypothetical protein
MCVEREREVCVRACVYECESVYACKCVCMSVSLCMRVSVCVCVCGKQPLLFVSLKS